MGGIMLDWGVHLVSPGPGMLWALPGVGWVIGGQGVAWFDENLSRLLVCEWLLGVGARQVWVSWAIFNT